MTMDRRRNRAAVQVRKISNEETFRAQNEGRNRKQNETFRSEDGQAHVEYEGADRVLMWKPVINDNGEVRDFVPRIVPTSHIGFNQANGWRSTCPYCNTNHEDSKLPPSDPNSCPAKAKVAVRLCPVCGDRMVDNQGWHGEQEGLTEDGETVISNDFNDLSTPETRTLQQLHIHLWMRHPRQAQMMGIPELQGAFREAVNSIRPT